MIYAYRNAAKLNPETRKVMKRVCNECKVCSKFKKSQGRPKVAVSKSTDFNQVVTMDLKQFGSENVLWLVDSFTKVSTV